MKIEFLVNQDINDGKQIFIQESEFKKALNDEDEFNNFAFATHCLFMYYGCDDYIREDEYEIILEHLERNGAVIITIVEEKYPRRFFPEVYVSNNNKLKRIDLSN
jgi:predicted Rossmann fold nucleotide-binding protein DprA/Smf involved in DNA uptake